MRDRRGFTLMEMAIVLAIMAIASGLVVPALVDLGRTPQRRTADALLSLLTASRKLAIERSVTVRVMLDPRSGRYRVDTSGTAGAGPVTESQLDLLSAEPMITDLPRLNYIFHPTGSALGDTVRVRGADSSLVVHVDRWNGVAYAGQQ